MAEAVLNRKGAGRFEAHSAGSAPAVRVDPLAIRALHEGGLEWRGHPPRGVSGLERHAWDFVITVCDKARESCPVFPGQPVLAHWGMPDPAAVVGSETVQAEAFAEALRLISRRIDLMLALPIEKLERLALESRLRAIGNAATTPETAGNVSPFAAVSGGITE
jgi:arsenate reductase